MVTNLGKKMADVFDDEAEQTVSIDEYLKGVEEQELVCFFLTHNLIFSVRYFSGRVYTFILFWLQ